MIPFEYLLLIGSILILVSIAIAKFSDNLGVPTLLLFLGIGMLAGSDGPGGIYFNDPTLAQSIGVIALVFILFAGGIETKWRAVRHAAGKASLLATVGVVVTAVGIAIFTWYVLNFNFYEGLLLGAIVSSTDAAAVFSVLRAKRVSLKDPLAPLLELESGSNDPMAVFLTVGTLQLLTVPEKSIVDIIFLFALQMGIGLAFGAVLGKIMVWIFNNLKFSYEGIYPVFALSWALFVYALTSAAGGSGFLAIYTTALIVGNQEFVHKKSIVRFFDGLSWLGQIAMFITLGLLVFPSHIIPVIGTGIAVSLFLIVAARPLGVFLSLIGSGLGGKEKIFISWVGLRGAVPVILATFPLLAGVPEAEIIFNIVFFIVLTSALIQGWTIPFVAKFLGLTEPVHIRRSYPIDFEPLPQSDTKLVDLMIPPRSSVIGKTIIELGFPPDSLVVLINRNDSFIVPSGGTVIEMNDILLVIVNDSNLPAIRDILSEQISD